MKERARLLRSFLDLLGSYGLACVLLGFLFILTFLGTIEQTEHGLYEVQKKYFESLFLVHELGGVVPIPLPGVTLVLIVLAANLLVGGIVRPRKSLATVGVLVTHVGIVVMLLAGFVKLEFSNDGNLVLFEKEASDEYQSYFEWEVAITDASQTANVKELLIPDEDLVGLKGDATRTFDGPELPFRLTLSRFERNCRALPAGPTGQAANPAIDGYALHPEPLAKEAEQNVAGVYCRVEDRQGGSAREGILWGFARYPFVAPAGGKTWSIDIRKKRFKMPFTIVLDKFTRELHPNTMIARVFMSDVTKLEDGISQRVKIQMNEPLRRDGLVLFQASWGPENAQPGQRLFSVFAVVRNPSDQWPLISCIVVGLGMLLTFTQKLTKYMKDQAAERSSA